MRKLILCLIGTIVLICGALKVFASDHEKYKTEELIDYIEMSERVSGYRHKEMLSTINQLILSGADVNAHMENGQTLLSYALSHDMFRLAILLTTYAAQIQDKKSMLHDLAKNSRTQSELSRELALHYLLSGGSEYIQVLRKDSKNEEVLSKIRDSITGSEWFPVWLILKMDVINLSGWVYTDRDLLWQLESIMSERGANIETLMSQQDDEGLSVLHSAIKWKTIDSFIPYITSEVLQIKNDKGETPFQFALKINAQIEAIVFILNGYNPWQPESGSESPLHLIKQSEVEVPKEDLYFKKKTVLAICDDDYPEAVSESGKKECSDVLIYMDFLTGCQNGVPDLSYNPDTREYRQCMKLMPKDDLQDYVINILSKKERDYERLDISFSDLLPDQLIEMIQTFIHDDSQERLSMLVNFISLADFKEKLSYKFVGKFESLLFDLNDHEKLDILFNWGWQPNVKVSYSIDGIEQFRDHPLVRSIREERSDLFKFYLRKTDLRQRLDGALALAIQSNNPFQVLDLLQNNIWKGFLGCEITTAGQCVRISVLAEHPSTDSDIKLLLKLFGYYPESNSQEQDELDYNMYNALITEEPNKVTYWLKKGANPNTVYSNSNALRKIRKKIGKHEDSSVEFWLSSGALSDALSIAIEEKKARSTKARLLILFGASLSFLEREIQTSRTEDMHDETLKKAINLLDPFLFYQNQPTPEVAKIQQLDLDALVKDLAFDGEVESKAGANTPLCLCLGLQSLDGDEEFKPYCQHIAEQLSVEVRDKLCVFE